MRSILIIFLLFFPVAIAYAQGSPIEVTADEALEWDRANSTVTARGSAVVKQGSDSISAPTIIAKYTESDRGIEIQSVTASPKAVLIQPGQTLTANSVTAAFSSGALSTVTAKGNVVLKTEKETLYGDQADYDALRRVVVITGSVRILQGKNYLSGDRAEFDLNTNVSTLTGTPGSGGRVRAEFFAGEAK